MKKAVATRLDVKDKEKFKELAHRYQMSESVLLRLLINAVNVEGEKLMPLIFKAVKQKEKIKRGELT